MSETTKIRWTNKTWNPVSGCRQISAGCDHCYARTLAEKFRGSPAYPVGFDPVLKPNRLRDPYRWREPSRIFVNSMSDLFLRDWPRDYVDQVFDIMVEVDRHVYQVLTKRPKRMRDYLCGPDGYLARRGLDQVPPHIWLGTSIETDAFSWRADVLRAIPAPVHFISAEPLLAPLPSLDLTCIEWLIVGGESGPGYRPMDHAWASGLRDQALANGTAFFFKQSAAPRTEMGLTLDGERWEQMPTLHPAERP